MIRCETEFETLTNIWSTAMVLIPKQERLKLNPRSDECVLVGYCVLSKHIVFTENLTTGLLWVAMLPF